MPTKKVTSGALAGAITAIGVWAADAFGGVKIPAETAVSISVVLTFVTQYFVTDTVVA